MQGYATSAQHCSRSLTQWLVVLVLLFAAVNVTLCWADTVAQDVIHDDGSSFPAQSLVPYHSDLYPPSMLLLLLGNGQLEAYDMLLEQDQRLLWQTNTSLVGALDYDTGGVPPSDRPRERMHTTPSLARAATDPLALPFIVRGNRLFTRLPLWTAPSEDDTSHAGGTDDVPYAPRSAYRTQFYHDNIVDNSLPEEVQPHFFMNVSTLIRRQRVQAQGTEVYVTTSVTFDDIDSFTGEVLDSSAHFPGETRRLSSWGRVTDASAVPRRRAVGFPKLHLSQHTITIHAYCPGEYHWTIELSSVDLTENAVYAHEDVSQGSQDASRHGSGSTHDEANTTRTTRLRRHLTRLAEVFEKVRGTVRPPPSLQSLRSRVRDSELEASSTRPSTRSPHPIKPGSLVLSQNSAGVIHAHHVDSGAKHPVTTLPSNSALVARQQTVSAAFLYTPQRSSRNVERIPFVYSDDSVIRADALGGYEAAPQRLLPGSESDANVGPEATPMTGAGGGAVGLWHPPHDWLAGGNEDLVDAANRLGRGFRDVDLEAEDAEGSALERVFSGYRDWNGESALLVRRMMMSSTELAKELAWANGLPSPAVYTRFWRWVVLLLLHAAALAASVGFTLTGATHRKRLLDAFDHSARARHRQRPTASNPAGHGAALPVHGGELSSPQMFFDTVSTPEFPLTSPGESFAILPPSATVSESRITLDSDAVNGNTAMAHAARWSAMRSSSNDGNSSSSSNSSSSASTTSSSDTDNDDEDDVTAASCEADGDARAVAWSAQCNGGDNDEPSARTQIKKQSVTKATKLAPSDLVASADRQGEVTQNTNTSPNGRLFQEHFRIISRIGAGGEGCVFCVEHRVTRVKYAVKAVHIQEQDEKRVVQEAVLHSSFDNPHVVRFYFCWIQTISMNESEAMQLQNTGDDMDEPSFAFSSSGASGLDFSDEDDNNDEDKDTNSDDSDDDREEEMYRVLFIQMEYFPFGTLADELALRRSFYRIDNLLYIRQIAEGLEYLHDMDVVHRDLKPTNIFLSVNPHRARLSTASAAPGRTPLDPTEFPPKDKILKIGDFGLAKQRQGANANTVDLSGNVAGGLNEQSIVGGTPLYCSPEQLAGKALGRPTDIFSLGIIAVELYCLFTTFHERSRVLTEARNQQLPDELSLQFPQEAKLITSMLSPYPSRRPTVTEVLAKLEGLIEKEEEANREMQRSRRAAQVPSAADSPLTPMSAGSPPKLWRGMAPSTSSGHFRSPTSSTDEVTPLPSCEPTLTAGPTAAPPSLMTSVKTLLMSPVSSSPHHSPVVPVPLKFVSPTPGGSAQQGKTAPRAADSDWLGASTNDSPAASSMLASAPASYQFPSTGKSRGTLFFRPQRSSMSVASVALGTEDDQSICSVPPASMPPQLDFTALSGVEYTGMRSRVASMNAMDDFLECNNAAYGAQRVELPFTNDPDLPSALRANLKPRSMRPSSFEKV